jgi:hypothetical protein
MLAIHESQSVEEASGELLDFILMPNNWVALETLERDPQARPGQNAAYQRRVGNLRICASVDVSEKLEVFLRVAFRGPNLTPAKAADHLESFLKRRVPLTPNCEWQVEVDARRWIHFMRKYTGPTLRG